MVVVVEVLVVLAQAQSHLFNLFDVGVPLGAALVLS